MIFDIKKAKLAFEIFVKKGKLNGKIVIFVSFNIDAIAALRIFIFLITSENIKYQVIPVFNNDQLEEKIDKLKNNEGLIEGFVFINCGGNIDFTKSWITQNEIKIIIQDIKRPINHNNINESKTVIIFDDKYYNFENCPTEEEILEVQRIQKSQAENNFEGFSSDEDTIEEDDDEALEENLYDFDEEDNEEKENEENGNDEPSNEDKNENKIKNNKKVKKVILNEKQIKKNELKKKKLMKKKIFQSNKEKIEKYYSGNYYGMPSAYIFYKMTCELNRENSDMLWLSITGSIDHYLSSHLTTEQYDIFYSETEKHARLLNLHYGYNVKPKKTTYIEENGGKEEEIQPETQNKLPKCIFTESDCRLFLYKYWNVYDSFIYSEFTVSTLLTWKEQGKEEINKILALIGIPNYEAKQKFIYMKTDLKKLFKKKLPEISNKFIKNFMFNSFNFQFDEVTQMSAGDYVSCLNALLNNPFSKISFSEMNNEENEEIIEGNTNNGKKSIIEVKEKKKNDINLTTEDDKKEETNHDDSKKDMYYDNFWIVFNFLSLKCTGLFPKAIEIAIDFQKSMVSLATSIIDRNMVNPSSTFRYTILADLSDQIKYIQNPLSLEKFGLLVLEIYEKYRSTSTVNFVSKPLVLGVLDGNKYLVAGVVKKDKTNEDEKNLFPFRFKLSANKIKAKLLLSSFNESIIEIKKEDMLSFVDALISDD